MQKIKFQGPSSYFIFQGPSSLQVSFFFSTACWCSPTFVRRLFYFLLLRIPQKNTFATQRLQWNLVDVAILVFRQPTDHIAGLQQGLMRLDLMIKICVRWISWSCHPFEELYCDMDIVRSCSFQVWDRLRQCGTEGSKINSKMVIVYEFIKEVQIFDLIMLSGPVQEVVKSNGNIS